MKRALLLIFIVPWLTTGCIFTPHMLHRGWAIQTSSFGAEKYPHHRAPVATKNANGDIQFEYDALQYHLSGIGNRVENPPPRLLRITNVISHAALQPITNVPFLGAQAIFPTINDTAAYVTNGGCLPFKKLKFSADARWQYPPMECVFHQGDWYWYVPSRDEGTVPKIALLSPTKVSTPPQAYMVRIFMVPVYLVGDIIFDPPLILLLAFGGEGL